MAALGAGTTKKERGLPPRPSAYCPLLLDQSGEAMGNPCAALGFERPYATCAIGLAKGFQYGGCFIGVKR